MFDIMFIILAIIVGVIAIFIFVHSTMQTLHGDLIEGQTTLFREMRDHHEIIYRKLNDMADREMSHYRELAQRVTRVDIADDMK